LLCGHQRNEVAGESGRDGNITGFPGVQGILSNERNDQSNEVFYRETSGTETKNSAYKNALTNIDGRKGGASKDINWK